MYYVVVLVAIVTGVLGQSQQDGNCAIPEGVLSDIDVVSMLGEWHQIARIPNTDELGDCSTTTFDAIDWTEGIILNKEVVNGTTRTRKGSVTLEDNSGRISIVFDSVKYDYYLLATDYNNYAVLYSCKNTSENTKDVWAWKFSRSKTLSPADEVKVDAAVARVSSLRGVEWRVTEQNCSTRILPPILAAIFSP